MQGGGNSWASVDKYQLNIVSFAYTEKENTAVGT